MDFHFQRTIARKILHIRLKNSSHPHFLSRAHIVVIQHQSCFLERSIRIGITFRLGVRRLMILVRVLTIVYRFHGNVVSVLRLDIFVRNRFDTIHFNNLRMFRRRSLVQIGDSRFFPSVPDHSQMHNLHFRFGNTVTQLAHPKPTELRFRKNG